MKTDRHEGRTLKNVRKKERKTDRKTTFKKER